MTTPVEFCSKATELLRKAELIKPDQAIRLPSEAEWEYAARAGSKSVYSFGDDAKTLGDYAWSTHNAAGNDPAVGAKRPNAWGLFDVHGYLWEWCADNWHEGFERRPQRRLGLDDRRRHGAPRVARRQLERSGCPAHQQLSPRRPHAS